MEEEHKIWVKAMEDKVPSFYEGRGDLSEQKKGDVWHGCFVSPIAAPAVLVRHGGVPWTQMRRDAEFGCHEL